MEKKLQIFLEKGYQINEWSVLQKDRARKKPQISAGIIFKSLLYQTMLGIKSILKLDQHHRTRRAKRMLESERKMVVSDSTLLRVLEKWEIEFTSEALYACHKKLRARGLASLKLRSGKKVMPAIVDGTCLGNHWFSVLSFGGKVYHGVDAEPYEGRGHELNASRRLIRRVHEKIGDSFATHILYDGLMADRKDFEMAREFNTHLLVKTSEETLSVIEDHQGLWNGSLSEELLQKTGTEIAKGFDAEHGMKYETYCARKDRWEGLRYPLSVCRVRETHVKGKYKNQTLTFWILTTDLSLTGLELRELAHTRWKIENNGFKELNEQTGSKKAYIKNPKVKQAWLLIVMLGMLLLKAFENHLSSDSDWIALTAKKTKSYLAQLILDSIAFSTDTQLLEAPP